MDRQGLLLCAKYAVSPNFFGYCGPRKSASLIDHLKENVADPEMAQVLSDFETMYPYLQLIARQNKINDPFDQRVVEAYWIGNSLLKPVDNLEYRAFSKEKLILDKKLSKIDFQKLLTNISKKSFLPHHAFHVFNVFKRMGNELGLHALETMDQCRIGWSRIVKYQISNIKYQKHKQDIKNLLIEAEQLKITNKKLKLGRPKIREIKIDYKGKQFIREIKAGDWVSFHWGYLCDVLKEEQVKNLKYYTKKAIEFYNL
jgi:hydrogenase maturation factor